MTRPPLLLLAGLIASLGSAHAQATEAPAPYTDRVIEGIAPDTSETDASPPYNASGMPRFLRLETRLGSQPFTTGNQLQATGAVYALIETPSHGTLSLDGAWTPAAHGQPAGSTLTLRQRGLPLAGNSLAHLEAGIVYAPTPDTLRLPSRVSVPGTALRGATAEWQQPAQGLQIQLSGGRPGQLQSQPASGFDTLPGQRQQVAGQWHLQPEAADSTTPSAPPSAGRSHPGWTLAFQHENARGVTASGSANALQNARSTLLAVRHESEQLALHARALGTQTDPADGTTTPAPTSGAWLDAEWTRGPLQHSAGAYRLGEDLTWAGLPMASDATGLYYRFAWRTRQWTADASLDHLRSVSGRARAGQYATANTRWRLARDSSLGLGTALRSFDSTAMTLYADWRWRTGWGQSGLRLDLQSGIGDEPAQQTLSWDQDWNAPSGWTLGSRLSLLHSGAGASGTGLPVAADTRLAAALSLAAPIGSRAQVRGSLDTEQASPTTGSRYSLNLGGSWRIDPRWTLEGNLTRSRGRALTTTSIDPLAPPVETTLTQRDRSFSAVLRYEQQAGSRSVPLGGKPQEGGGRISGTVFLDANRSGTQEAGETGAPGVTIYLDNRYAVRTDAQGRFEFPLVAPGPRTVTVRNETLPLPWAVVDEGQVKVDVRLREATTLLIPVQRAD